MYTLVFKNKQYFKLNIYKLLLLDFKETKNGYFNIYKLMLKNQFKYKKYKTNICFFSYRKKSIFFKFNMSRMVLKYFGTRGMLNGIKKHSW